MAEDVSGVPYIGEKTARELRKGLSRNKRGKTLTPRRAANLNKDFLQVKLDKRQRKELAKYVGDPESSLLTREERAEESRQQQTSSSEPGDDIRRGDYRVDRDLYKEAQDLHEERSAEAKRVDQNRRARVTTDFSKWANNMGHFDYPGIDTPNRRKVRRQEKDRGFVDNNALLRPFEDKEEEQPKEEEFERTRRAAVFMQRSPVSGDVEPKVKADMEAGGLGTGIRKQIKEQVNEQVGFDEGENGAIAEVMLGETESEGFGYDREIIGISQDTDAQPWEF